MNQLENDFDHLNYLLGGMESLLQGKTLSEFDAMTGNESYYALHLDAKQFAGFENAFTDGIKKSAKQVYDTIVDVLKRIREYFFGEGEKAAETAEDNAKETVDALLEMSGDTPIPEDSPALNPDAYIKALEGGTEFNELKENDSVLGSSIDKVKAACLKVRDCKTVGQLRNTYAEIVKAAIAGNAAVTNSLRKTVGSADAAANKLRNPKVPAEDDPAEVKNAIKAENKEIVDDARAETAKARLIGGIRNKFVNSLNAVSKLAKGIKEKPTEPKFKG